MGSLSLPSSYDAMTRGQIAHAHLLFHRKASPTLRLPELREKHKIHLLLIAANSGKTPPRGGAPAAQIAGGR